MFTVKLELDQNYHMPASTYNHPAGGWKTASKPWRVHGDEGGLWLEKAGSFLLLYSFFTSSPFSPLYLNTGIC